MFGGDRRLLVSGRGSLHINLLKLLAIHLALKAFLPSIKGRLVQVFTGNTTAMWYCNGQGWVVGPEPKGLAPLDVAGMPGNFPVGAAPAGIFVHQGVKTLPLEVAQGLF